MTSENEFHIFPVAGWNIGTLPEIDAIFIQIAFLTSPLQTMGQADPGRRYAFQREQLHELQRSISSALLKLENAGYQPPQGPLQ